MNLATNGLTSVENPVEGAIQVPRCQRPSYVPNVTLADFSPPQMALVAPLRRGNILEGESSARHRFGRRPALCPDRPALVAGERWLGDARFALAGYHHGDEREVDQLCAVVLRSHVRGPQFVRARGHFSDEPLVAGNRRPCLRDRGRDIHPVSDEQHQRDPGGTPHRVAVEELTQCLRKLAAAGPELALPDERFSAIPCHVDVRLACTDERLPGHLPRPVRNENEQQHVPDGLLVSACQPVRSGGQPLQSVTERRDLGDQCVGDALGECPHLAPKPQSGSL